MLAGAFANTNTSGLGAFFSSLGVVGVIATVFMALVTVTGVSYVLKGGLQNRARELQAQTIDAYDDRVKAYEATSELHKKTIASLTDQLEAEKKDRQALEEKFAKQEKRLAELALTIKGLDGLQTLARRLDEVEAHILEAIGGRP